MMRSTLSVTSLVALFALVAACGGAPSAPASPEGEHGKGAPAATTNAKVKAPGDAKMGDTTTCPISGEEFVVDASSPKVEHEGKTYYLCCNGCKKKFEADPAKYLKKS